MTIGRIIVALDSMQNQLVIMMTEKGCTCLIYPKPLIKKMVHEGGELWAQIFPVGAPWCNQLSSTRTMVLG